MSTVAFALPASRLRLDPMPEPGVAGFKVGDAVRWLLDGDTGLVLRVIPDQALAIQWDGTSRIDWYSAWSGSLHHIEPFNGEDC